MNFKALLPYFIIGYIISLIGIFLYAIYTPESDLSPRIYIIILLENEIIEDEDSDSISKTVSDTPLPVIGKLQATI